MDYEALSDDIIRFADAFGLEKFTLLGHSMGGRASLTTACRYPHRVDGVISIDAAPVNEKPDHDYFGFVKEVIEFMYQMSVEKLTKA